MLYLISYYLFTPAEEGPPLLGALKKAGAVHVIDGAWILPSDTELAPGIYDEFAKYVDTEAGEQLLVTEITQNSALTKRLFTDVPTLSSLFDRARRGP